MRALLEDVNSLPGVIGSMFCDARGEVLSRAFPAEFDDGSLAAVASAVATSLEGLRSSTGSVGVVDLRYRESRVVVRPAGSASLVVFCSRAADAQELLAFASVACKKLERLQSGDASRPAAAPAAPAATQAPPAPAAPDPVPAGRSRRVLLLAGAAAAAVVVLGIAALAVHLQVRERRPEAGPPVTLTPAPPEPARAPAPTPPLEVKLRVSGTETLAAELAPALATAYLGNHGASELQSVREGPDEVVVRGVVEGAALGVRIHAGSTAQGLEDLLAGRADVALASRRIGPEERQRFTAAGAPGAALREHVLGVDGITVVVNKENPVAALTREQLAAILGGSAGDWGRLAAGQGGAPVGEIHVYLPDDRSGIPEALQALVLAGKPLAPAARRLATPRAVTDAVSSDRGGIGLVPMAAVAGARAVPVGGGRETPRLPTAFTVASEDYPLSRRLYLYTAEAGAGAEASQLVELALSAEGQALLRRAGFVELGARAEARADAAPAAPSRPPAPGRGAAPAPSVTRAEPRPPVEATAAGAASVAPAPAPAAAQPTAAAPAPGAAPPDARAIEDAPVYASSGYLKPKMTDPGCVQRELRMPAEVLDRVGGKPMTVKFAVSRDGKPGRFQVVTPGIPAAGGAAIWSAIQACKWTPGADEAGEPAEIWVIMPFRFAGQ